VSCTCDLICKFALTERGLSMFGRGGLRRVCLTRYPGIGRNKIATAGLEGSIQLLSLEITHGQRGPSCYGLAYQAQARLSSPFAAEPAATSTPFASSGEALFGPL